MGIMLIKEGNLHLTILIIIRDFLCVITSICPESMKFPRVISYHIVPAYLYDYYMCPANGSLSYVRKLSVT